jgi:hypothetical protein
VFASADEPQSDWTASLVPGTSASIRLGRARLTGQGNITYQYFRKFASERSLNTRGSVRFLAPLNRLELAVGVTMANSRQRQGAEITSRVRRFENGFNLDANVRITGRSSLGVTAGRVRYTFPDDAVYLDTNLSTSLARHEDRAGVVYTNQVTSLTTLRVTAEVRHDRFLHTTGRDADGIRVMGGFETSPFALVQGSAFIGYQRYEAVAQEIPGFDGLVGSADLTYVARGATRFNVRVDRALAYSYDVIEPYYLVTDVAGSVGRHIVRRLEAFASAGRQRMRYRRAGAATGEVLSRLDWTTTYGIGVAVGFARSGRVRVSLDGSSRNSVHAPQNYDSHLISASVDYAF